MTDLILSSLHNGVFTITLNYPAKMNCMGFEMLEGLNDAINFAKKSEDVKVIVITGAGEKAFSSGANIKDFKALKDVFHFLVLGMEKWFLQNQIPRS